MTFSLPGSILSWLKYIGRTSQLLTIVHVLPLSPDRNTPARAGSRGGGVAPWSPPRPKPPPGPALLHQLYPPRPPPAVTGAAAADCGAGAPPRAPGAPGGVTAAAPGGVASVLAFGSAPRAGAAVPVTPASTWT